MDVPPESTIVDERKKKEFTKFTISKYKRTEVLKSLLSSLTEQKVELACTWLVELHCSGQMETTWKQLIYYMSEQINTNSPYIALWTWKMYERYIKLEELFDKQWIHETRNNQQMRNLIADLIVILLFSRKIDAFNKKIIPKVMPDDFNREVIKQKLIAKNSYMICNIIDTRDPPELQLALNEFATHLNRDPSSFDETVYWLQWMIAYEEECKKMGAKVECAGIKLKNINEKFYTDWIWYIWQIIVKEAEYRNEKPLFRQIVALYKLYKLNFSTSTRKRKMVHIYHAIKLIKTNVDWTIPLIDKYHIRVQVCGNINQLYKQIAFNSGTNIHQGNIALYEELKEKSKHKKSKHKKKIEDQERAARRLDLQTQYLKVINIPKMALQPKPTQTQPKPTQTQPKPTPIQNLQIKEVGPSPQKHIVV